MPTLSEYAIASQGAKDRNSAIAGLTPLGITSDLPADGFYGTAYVNASNQIIVAFAPLSLDLTTEYGRNSSLAALAIVNGQTPVSFTNGDVGKFMAQVQASAAGRPIFATGFSLGGVTAEYVAKTYGLGGAAFGSPGLPGNLITSSSFANYLNYGDPVANYGTDTAYGAGIGTLNQYHYGNIAWLGQISAQQTLTSDAQSALKTGDDIATLAFLSQFASDALYYHDLNVYRTDLGLSPGPTNSTEPLVIGGLGGDGSGDRPHRGGRADVRLSRRLPFLVHRNGRHRHRQRAYLNVLGGNDVVNLGSNGAADLFGPSYTTHGDACAITLGANTSANIVGRFDTIDANYASDYVGICQTGDLSNINTINAVSGASIGAISGAAVNVVGSNESITLSPNAYLGVFGTGENVLNAGGCTVGAPSGSTWNQTGSNVTDILSPNCYMGVLGGSTGVAIGANNDSFGAQFGTSMTVKGSNDGFTAYGASIGILSGDQGMFLNAADSQVTSLTNTSIVDTNGSSSSFAGQRGDVMTLYGNNMTVFGNYMTINFVGSYDTCDGNWNTVEFQWRKRLLLWVPRHRLGRHHRGIWPSEQPKVGRRRPKSRPRDPASKPAGSRR